MMQISGISASVNYNNSLQYQCTNVLLYKAADTKCTKNPKTIYNKPTEAKTFPEIYLYVFQSLRLHETRRKTNDLSPTVTA